MSRVFAFLFALASLGVTALAVADVPTEMSVQGRLTNGAGAPVPAGLKNFTFKIWDAAAGGTEIWPAGPGELQTLTTDANGLWNAGVGQIIPLSEAVFLNPVRWLEVTVDDGVNPIETLPRIELRTNPYTYRSATSQQADSIGGLSLFDLADRFVDTSGDVMTGVLHNDRSTQDAGPSIDVENFNDGYVGYWNNLAGNWAIHAEAMGDDNLWNIAIATAAIGNNSSAEANRGLYSVAGGTGSVNIGVQGVTQMDGVENYSGYFQSGDFVVTGPASSGTLGVQLPPNAISDDEILDEPGVAFSRRSTPISPLTESSTSQNFVTVTITTPDDGYIMLDGVGYFVCSGNGSQFAWIQISETSNAVLEGGHYTWVNAYDYANAVGSYTYESAPVKRFYFKAAGTYTFYLQGNAYAANDGSTGVGLLAPTWLQATYYPRAYGTASTVVESPGDFESATRVFISDPMTKASSVAYEVDLRELEVRAAQTALAAERARRELVEARLSAANGAVRSTATPAEEPKR